MLAILVNLLPGVQNDEKYTKWSGLHSPVVNTAASSILSGDNTRQYSPIMMMTILYRGVFTLRW
jgi:hypothetical protein